MSTNLPNTAYIKMIDCWLIFSLLKPFVDILVQTYLQTLGEDSQETAARQAWGEKQSHRKIVFCKTFLRVLYPTFFLTFVVIFWIIGLIHYVSL